MKQTEAIAHYVSLLPEFREDLEFFEQRLKEEGPGPHLSNLDKVGRYKQSIGIVSFLIDGDVDAFRRSAAQRAVVTLKRFEAFDRGELIDASYVTTGKYTDIFVALAAADFELARKLADVIGGRPEIELEHNHPVHRAMGYMVKSALIDEPHAERMRCLEVFRKAADKSKPGRNYLGYVDFFEALLSRDEKALEAGFDRIMVAYKRSAVRGGIMAADYGDAISLRGIGLVNYARHVGLRLEPNDPYVPEVLLI